MASSSTDHLSQKLAAFCLLFGDRKEAAKLQIQFGLPLDVVFEEMQLNLLSDLCRTLLTSGDEVNHFLASRGMVPGPTNSCAEPSQNSNDIDIDLLYRMEMNLVEGEPNSTPTKQFQCDYPECGLSYASKRNLSYHQKRHFATQQFRCTFAGCKHTAATPYYHKLIQHVERVHLNYRSRDANKEEYRKQAQQFVATVEMEGDSKQPKKQMPLSKKSTTSKAKARQQQTKEHYVCSEPGCGQQFTKKWNFAHHRCVHQRRASPDKKKPLSAKSNSKSKEDALEDNNDQSLLVHLSNDDGEQVNSENVDSNSAASRTLSH